MYCYLLDSIQQFNVLCLFFFLSTLYSSHCTYSASSTSSVLLTLLLSHSQIFAGVNNAARSTGIPIHQIHAVLAGKTDTAGGFKWRLAPGAPPYTNLTPGGSSGSTSANTGGTSGGGGSSSGSSSAIQHSPSQGQLYSHLQRAAEEEEEEEMKKVGSECYGNS